MDLSRSRSRGSSRTKRSLVIIVIKTLTATEARKNLTHWLKAASEGQEIGIVYGADVIALRPVSIRAADYPQREYAVSPAELRCFTGSSDSELNRERHGGQLKVFSGKLPRRRGR